MKIIPTSIPEVLIIEPNIFSDSRGVFFESFNEKKFNQSIELWFLIYYLLLLVGMFWTENSVFGMSKLENKLSFLVFPILFTFSKLTLSKKNIIDLFISGLLISLLIHLGIAVFKSIYYPEDN